MIESMLAGMDGAGGTGVRRPLFEINERDDVDGALRLTLIGELDLSVRDRLRAQLDELRRGRRRVRLDLSELEFVDCSGIGAILNALADARRNRWELEVDRLVSPIAARVISLGRLASELWPPDAVNARAGEAAAQ